MTYEVQTFTICDGWINTWEAVDKNGTRVPETFATEAEAEAAIEEFLDDIEAEIEAGDRHPEDGYQGSDFRVVQVGAA